MKKPHRGEFQSLNSVENITILKEEDYDGPIRVVVVDDDYEDFLQIDTLLKEVESTQYQLEWISNSTDAIERIKLQNGDVYFVDYFLDARTGLDILDQLKNSKMTKPIIILTGRNDLQVDIATMEKGASDFLSKNELTSSLLERSIRYSIKQCEDKEKLKELHLHRAEKEAAMLANKNKNQFIAGISHEIRTPLSSILGFVELAMEPNLAEKDRIEYLSIVKRNGEHLLDLINDFLDLAKLESGNIDIQEEDFQWKLILSDVIQALKPKAEEKGIVLGFEALESNFDHIKNDSHRFRQILFNLLSNAIKFTDNGYVSIACVVDSDSLGARNNLLVTITDSGIGLSSEEQQKIFKPFKQGNAKLVRKYGGTGLGLDLSKKMAQAMGGDLLLVNSTPSVGSTFKLVLPGCFSSMEKDFRRIPFKESVSMVMDSVKAQM